MSDKLQLTSVKVVPKIYKEFKILCMDTGLTLQKFLNRSLYLYNSDKKFQEQVDSTINYVSGSGL